MKFIVFTTDVPPIAGVPTSGTALRTHGLVQGLRANGHEVIVSAPKSSLRGLQSLARRDEQFAQVFKDIQSTAFDSRNQADLIENSGADAVLCGHWPALMCASKPSVPVIIDLAGPHLLERHYQGSQDQQAAILSKLTVLNRADYFIVSGAKQRLYFLSYLLRAKVPSAEKRICTIPMPLPPLPLQRGAQDASEYPHFVFGGVFLPWQDPSAALTALASELSRRSAGKLTCIGGKHPNYPIKGGVYEKLFDSLRKNKRVAIQPMQPYEDFIEQLGTKDIAVDVMRWNIERELAVTIRSTTYLWAGVPVIYNDFADLGKLITKYDAGWLVNPAQPEAFLEVVEEIFNNPQLVQEKSRNAQVLAAECFAWDKVVQRLLGLIGTRDDETTQEVDIVLDFPQNAELRLTQKKPIEQHFTCRVDGLSKIEFRVATHGASNPGSFRASLHLTDKGAARNGQSSIEVCSETFHSENIRNNDWHSLEFAPVKDSAGAQFLLRLESQSDDEHSAVSPWACNGSPYPLTDLLYGSTPLRGRALCVRTTCDIG